jgi:hypothetical protein
MGLSTLKKNIMQIARVCLLASIFFLTACGTTFKYNPKHDQSYPAIANNLGLEIAGGIDERTADQRRPEWSRRVEVIVARALADEVKHAGLFQRVKIHLSGPAHLDRFSYFVEFQVDAFEMAPQVGELEQAARTTLGAVMGLRGALISASIPTAWESQVKVTFEVFDPMTQQSIFRRSYSEARTLRANGYEGKSRQIEQTSECLESVIQQFVRDFSQRTPR